MVEKKYKALAPDGKTTLSISGPDNASNEQLKVAFQAAWDKVKPKETKSIDTKPIDNVTPAANAPARMESPDNGLAQTFLDVSKNAILNRPSAIPGSISKYGKLSLSNKLADLGNLTRTGAATLGGALIGYGARSSVAGSAAMSVIDQTLRKETGQPTDSSLFPGTSDEAHVGAMVTGALETEIMGSILPIAGRLAGLAGKTRIGNRALELLKLKPTLGQLTGHEGLENLFNKTRKVAAIEESTILAKKGIDDVVSKVTGRTNPSMETLSELHQAEASSAFRQFVNASNKEADNVIATSELYPHTLPGKPIVTQIQVPNPTSLFGQTNTVTQTVPGQARVVKGPVWANNAIPKLVDIRNELIPTHLSPDPDTPVANAIRGIFKDMNAEFNIDGSLKSYDPMDFQTAWKNKQIIDKLGYGNTVENLNATDGRFRSISKALNQDIDQSIYKWSSDPNDLQTLNNANASWKKAKGIVSVRHALFGPEGETGLSTKTFLNTKNAPDPISNAILYDHKKMDRFLKTGNFKFGDTVISSTNAKKDMQGYALQKIFYDNWEAADPLNLNIGVANGDKMATDFINYTRSKAGQNLFSKQQVAAYSDMFDAIKKVTKSPGQGFSKYLVMNFGTRTVSLGSAILAGSYGAGTLGAATVAGGELSLYGMARIMTNKQSAPLFNAMLHNRPLGMSFQAASRAMVQALSGQRLTLSLSDGTQQESLVATDGKIRPIK